MVQACLCYIQAVCDIFEDYPALCLILVRIHNLSLFFKHVRKTGNGDAEHFQVRLQFKPLWNSTWNTLCHGYFEVQALHILCFSIHISLFVKCKTVINCFSGGCTSNSTVYISDMIFFSTHTLTLCHIFG